MLDARLPLFWRCSDLCCEANAGRANTMAGCQWTGNAPQCAGRDQEAACPVGYGQLTSSSRGDGGSQPCDDGSHQSLCCPLPIPFNTDSCAWHSNTVVPGVCRIGCPAGKVQLAVDSAGPHCLLGQGSFCCDPPAGSSGAVSPMSLGVFKATVNSWLSGGAKCKVGSEAAAVRKLAETTMADIGEVESLGLGSSSLDVARLLTPIVMQYNSGYGAAMTYGREWDAAVDKQSLINVHFLDLPPAMHPPYLGAYDDPIEAMNEILCSGTLAKQLIQDVQAEAAQICVLPTAVNPRGCPVLQQSIPGPHKEKRKRRQWWEWTTANASLKRREEAAGGHVLEPRTISDVPYSVPKSQTGGRPTIGALMEAVVNGRMSFQYRRLEAINGGSEGILEVAWLMAPNNNRLQLDTNLQESEGTDVRTGVPDAFFVMHFHVDHLLRDSPDDTYHLGIFTFNAFHGQVIDRVTNRVNGRALQAQNLRTELFRCPGHRGGLPSPDGQFFYPGYPSREQPTIFSDFAHYLWGQGILTADIFNSVSCSFSPIPHSFHGSLSLSLSDSKHANMPALLPISDH